MTPAVPSGQRIAVFSRYGLADQFDLAAEFKDMLAILASRNAVLHLSFRSMRPPSDVPAGLQVRELRPMINRRSPRDVHFKFILLYCYLPVIALRLRQFKPDLIFLSEVLPLLGVLLKWMTGARVATGYGDWHFHNMLGGKKWSKPLLALAEKLDRFEVLRLDGLFCRATAAGERLKSWGVKPELIRVVRDAPDPDAFYPRAQQELRHRSGFKDNDIVLLYHGVMHSGKGLDKLISWVDDLYREDSRVGLILVGGGPEQGALRQQAAALAVSRRVFFTGWLRTIREVGDYCNAADICMAMRTASEANARIVPGALLHSMACRKVVVAPRLSGMQEIIREGDNGYLFAPDDGEDFKRLVRRLAANRADWLRVAENAYRDIINNYSVPAAARQYAAALEAFAGDVKHAKP